MAVHTMVAAAWPTAQNLVQIQLPLSVQYQQKTIHLKNGKSPKVIVQSVQANCPAPLEKVDLTVHGKSFTFTEGYPSASNGGADAIFGGGGVIAGHKYTADSVVCGDTAR